MIKVLFIAKIKNLNDDYLSHSKKLRALSETLPGFIDIKSEEIDDVEITISSWRSKKDVDDWAKHPVHIEAKQRSHEWYHWVKGIHIEASDD
jgi:heme-degrading monooxygenase HmoA